jgi:hypothetical protein
MTARTYTRHPRCEIAYRCVNPFCTEECDKQPVRPCTQAATARVTSSCACTEPDCDARIVALLCTSHRRRSHGYLALRHRSEIAMTPAQNGAALTHDWQEAATPITPTDSSLLPEFECPASEGRSITAGITGHEQTTEGPETLASSHVVGMSASHPSSDDSGLSDVEPQMVKELYEQDPGLAR